MFWADSNMISATADHDGMIEKVPDVFSGSLIETATTVSQSTLRQQCHTPPGG